MSGIEDMSEDAKSIVELLQKKECVPDWTVWKHLYRAAMRERIVFEAKSVYMELEFRNIWPVLRERQKR